MIMKILTKLKSLERMEVEILLLLIQ